MEASAMRTVMSRELVLEGCSVVARIHNQCRQQSRPISRLQVSSRLLLLASLSPSTCPSLSRRISAGHTEDSHLSRERGPRAIGLNVDNVAQTEHAAATPESRSLSR